MSEALLLSVVGFLPGLLFSWGLYQMIERFTQIIMFIDAHEDGPDLRSHHQYVLVFRHASSL